MEDGRGVSDLPDPVVPPEVDLRDFGYMPLDVLRLRDSDLATLASGDEFRAAVLLWCAAWHQVPAASLPDDDRLLARYSATGPAWRKVKTEALRGFVKCSDGRLYHSVIAEKACESWEAKLRQRARTRAATEARERNRREAQERADVERNEQRNVERNGVQGIGIGIGIGKEKEKTLVAAAATTDPLVLPTVKAKDLISDGVDRQHAADWLTIRKAKRAPLTPTAWDDAKAEGLKAGLDPAKTVATAVANNWAGFKANWLTSPDVRNGQSGGLDFDGVH